MTTTTTAAPTDHTTPGRIHPADTARHANRISIVHHTPTPATDLDIPSVRWPDPSPLDNWWTEVMDGALTPVAAPAAEL
ncbi:hypothetical protein [Nocardia miyunensis]|uniref:hypothetical protein n=1 Tax=Nocardia miyunensis TaxID=282684 RepID=UPI000AC38CDA|nr:hypothetical protein [Nocardia miyunensis]